MTARHHFYGLLHADDIVDLPGFIAAQPGVGETITDLGELVGQFPLVDPDAGPALATSLGTTWLVDHRAPDVITVTPTADGFTATASRPPGLDPAISPTWQVVWMGSKQPESALSDNGQFALLFQEGETHTVTGLSADQVWSVIGVAISVPPGSSEPDYRVGTHFIRLSGDHAAITGARYYSPPYPGTDWRLAAAKGVPGVQGERGTRTWHYAGTWNADTTYHGGADGETPSDVVLYQGALYIMSDNFHSASGSAPLDPNNPTVWQLLMPAPPKGQDGKDGKDGTNGKDGRDGTNGTNGLDGRGFTNRGLWAANTTYAPYDVLTFAGSTYVVTTGFTSGATFSTANLQLWAASGSTWHVGSGAPPANLVAGPNDFYLDADSGDVYSVGSS